MDEMRKYSWNEIPVEKVSSTFFRQMIYGDKAMVSRLEIKKGSIIPEHSHENEQITWIMEGKLRFHMGGKEFDLSKGELIVIPSGEKHMATAMEDTIDIDIFAPPRMDWINKTDSYLRK
jgi:quercetin dioxygenase-like cupin family protein